jgi:membrane protease subunit HflC
MNNRSTLSLIAAAALFLIIIISSAFIVRETDQVIITRLGKPVRAPITAPGIHFKMPLLEDANFFEKRFLEWDGAANQIPTRDKRFIWVDSYARWRINDPLLFFQRVHDERGAHGRLDDIIDGETRNAIANHDLVEIIRNTNRQPQAEFDTLQVQDEMAGVFEEINTGRNKITREILENASKRIKELGIELLDVQFKRINYVEEVQRKIYERMITERKRIADRYRSEGSGEASKIIGDRERDLKRIQSEAYRTAQEIMGKADAEATAIFAKAYNQNEESRDFYKFVKTLETYKKTFSEKDWLILSTKSDFFRYMEKESGK